MSLGILALTVSSACTTSSTDRDAFSDADAVAITEACDAPEGVLRVQNGTLTLWPKKELDYDVSTCLLEKIRATGKSKFGFVGTEPYEGIEEK